MFVSGNPQLSADSERRAAALDETRPALGKQHSKLAEAVQRLPGSGDGHGHGHGHGRIPCAPARHPGDDFHSAVAALQRDLELYREQQRVSAERFLEQLQQHRRQTGALEESVAHVRRDLDAQRRRWDEELQDTLAATARSDWCEDRGAAAATATAVEGSAGALGEEVLLALRAEQQGAMASQAALFRKEFEAAYRAEQTAETALARLAGLERGLSEARLELGRDLDRLRADLQERVSAATENGWEHRLADVRAECAAGLDRLRTDLCSDVPAMAEAAGCAAARALLGQIQAVGTSAEARSEELRGRLEDAATRSQVQGEALTRLELDFGVINNAMEEFVKLRDTMAAERAAVAEDIAECRAQLQQERGEREGLEGFNNELADEISQVGQCLAELRLDVASRFKAEQEARTAAATKLREELLPRGVQVTAAKLEEWTELVKMMRAEFTKLANSGVPGREATGIAAPMARPGSLHVAMEPKLEQSPAAAQRRPYPASAPGSRVSVTSKRHTADVERLQARLSALMAVESMEAAAQKLSDSMSASKAGVVAGATRTAGAG